MILWLGGYASGFFVLVLNEMVLVLEKNRLDLGVSSRSTSTALLSTRNPDFLPRKLPEEPKILESSRHIPCAVERI